MPSVRQWQAVEERAYQSFKADPTDLHRAQWLTLFNAQPAPTDRMKAPTLQPNRSQ